MADIDNTQDILDIRDIIERVEALEDEQPLKDDEDLAELDRLKELLGDLAGYGGDEQWQGDWYPITLVRDSHFTDYARELAEDIGAVNTDASWPNDCIDWKRASRELQTDYSSVEYDGITYWYR